MKAIFLFILILNYVVCEDENFIDSNGYIAFCPCMGECQSLNWDELKSSVNLKIILLGRLGNQIEQFLGALSFGKDLNRTIVLPHLVEYPERVPTSVNNFFFIFYFYYLFSFLNYLLIWNFSLNSFI